MIPSSQPHRPQLPKPQIPVQQIRHNASQVSIDQKPRNQLEAMPPNGPSAQVTQPQQQQPPPPSHYSYNSALSHPVFFTQALRKPPFPLPQGASPIGMMNPAAYGYVAETAWKNAVNGQAGSRTKL